MIKEEEECPWCGATLEIEVPRDYGNGRCGDCGGEVVVVPDELFGEAIKLFIAFSEEVMPALQALAKSPSDLAELERISAGLKRL
ncbi:MAG: hypothetical protein HY978_00770 [Candidatus Liptonbacteria bacterium]|nr:hypothetical protein [Candidatus Liptonbacteria bacterium]